MADEEGSWRPLAILRMLALKHAASSTDEEEIAHHLSSATRMETLLPDTEIGHDQSNAAKGSRTRRTLIDDYALRMEEIITRSDDPDWLMDQILHDAERAGWIDASGAIRREPAWVFVLDLLLDNPRMGDWIGIAFEWLKPEEIEDEEQLLDTICWPRGYD